MANDGTRLELSNEAAELERLALALEAFGAERGVSPELISEINLVIEELVTNAFTYGVEEGRDPASVKASVAVGVSDGEVSVRIEDNGRPFDPLQVAPPDLAAPLEERQIGGLGVHLVRTLMDAVAYRREGGRNVVEMRKRIVG